MSVQLEQVKSICSKLDDTRVTARKKAEQQLRDMLSNTQIITSLDSVSRQGRSSDWCWQDVYRSTLGFVKKETDKMMEDLRKHDSSIKSKTSPTQKIKQNSLEVMSFLKMIIQKSVKHLTWATVVSDLLDMLSFPFMREHYSEDVLRLLTLAVSHPVSRSMILVSRNKNQWTLILDELFSILERPPDCVQPLALAELFLSTLRHGSKLTCLMDSVMSRDRIWMMVSEMIRNDEFARSDSDARLMVVEAAIIMMEYTGLDMRHRCCQLGEETMRDVIQVWNEKREQSKTAVIRFIKLQLSLHHPGGASDPDDGAMYGDRAVWTSQLKRVYVNIIETKIKNKMKSNKARQTRVGTDFLLCDESVRIGAETLYQLYCSPDVDQVGDVTQLIELDETQPRPAKKRRISGETSASSSSGVEILLREVMKSYELEEMRLPWLQILASLVSSHSSVVSDLGDNIVKMMTNLLSEVERSMVRDHIYRVLLHVTQAGQAISGTL